MKEVDEELERQLQKDDLSHEENYEWEGCCRERDSEEESEEEQEEKFSMKARSHGTTGSDSTSQKDG